MVDPHTVALIHAELDGELDAAASAELVRRLADDPQASALRTDLGRVSSMLARMQQVPVPGGLHKALLQAIHPRARVVAMPPPRRRVAIARYGFALAAGVVLGGIGLSLLQPERADFDPQLLVGTMGHPAGTLRDVQPRDVHPIATADVTGSVALQQAGGLWVLVFDLDASAPVTITARYDATGIRFNGYAQADSAAPSTSVRAVPGRIGFDIDGSRRLALFLAPAPGGRVRVRIEGAGRTVDEATFDIPRAGHLQTGHVR